MPKYQWFKFYATDWLADPHLRLCNAAARGVLIDLMALAHNGEPYGYVSNGGMALTEKQLVRVLAVNRQTLSKALAALELHGRIARAADDLLYIPRMVKDGAKLAQSVAHGKLGGNPKLKGRVKGRVKAEEEVEEEQKREQMVGVIYDAYPRKRNKETAFKAIRKVIAQRDPQEILAIVQEFAEAVDGADKKYVPYCSSWFNAGAYDDEDRGEWKEIGRDHNQPPLDTTAALKDWSASQ
jgi:hypothetical protein